MDNKVLSEGHWNTDFTNEDRWVSQPLINRWSVSYWESTKGSWSDVENIVWLTYKHWCTHFHRHDGCVVKSGFINRSRTFVEVTEISIREKSLSYSQLQGHATWSKSCTVFAKDRGTVMPTRDYALCPAWEIDFLLHHIINPLLTNRGSRWMGIGLVLFFACLWISRLDTVSVNKQAEKNLINIQPSWPHVWSITHIYTRNSICSCYFAWEFTNKYFLNTYSGSSRLWLPYPCVSEWPPRTNHSTLITRILMFQRNKPR